MGDDIIMLGIKDKVAYVTLNRPAVHNAFDDAMIKQLCAIFEDISGRDDVRAVVLRGAGKHFSAGADLNWMKRAADFTQEENKADALILAQMLNVLNHLPQLTIACVEGAAMGGGIGLVCCCDIVMAGESAQFALSEVKLGLIPATISPYVLAAIGARHARRYMQTGERFWLDEAYRIGLVHVKTQDADDMSAQLEALLKGVQMNGPRAMTASKKLCFDYSGGDITSDVIEETANHIAEIRAGDEAKEGLSAFLEKRKALF